MHILILLVVSFLAGIINTLAGGGSLLTMPTLIFLDLGSAMANGTNRIAILFQNATAIAGYKSKGKSAGSYGIFLGIAALLGATIGSIFAVDIPDEIFNKILAVVMVVIIVMTITNPALKVKNEDELVEQLSTKHKIMGCIALFFTGIYGGFIQAGTGLFIMASLNFINKFTLLKANVAKATIMFIYTIASLAVFIYNKEINFLYGIIMASSMSLGAWWASRWSAGSGQKYIKWFMIFAVIAMAISLWFKS